MIIDVFIPARGGSKGIPKKNLINFLGKPLIQHSIEYAQKCNLISNIYVSTDNQEIKNQAIKSNVKVIDRPQELANDEASTESAVEHYLKSLDYKPDLIVLLQPTSPHRPEGSLEKAIDTLIKYKHDSVLSISPTHNFFWKIKNETARPLYDYKKRPRRQDIPTEDTNYIENGSLYLFTYNLYKNKKNRLGGSIGYIVFEEQFSIEIDSMVDLKLLELICSEN